jgi:hypothetical protein
MSSNKAIAVAFPNYSHSIEQIFITITNKSLAPKKRREYVKTNTNAISPTKGALRMAVKAEAPVDLKKLLDSIHKHVEELRTFHAFKGISKPGSSEIEGIVETVFHDLSSAQQMNVAAQFDISTRETGWRYACVFGLHKHYTARSVLAGV